MKFPRSTSIFVGFSLSLAVVWPGPASASADPQTAVSPVRETPVERRVAPRKTRSESESTPTAQPATDLGTLDPAILERQIHSRFALLNGCPVEVARRQRSTPAAPKAHRLTLRWTILPNGRVADTAVVATSPVDSRVMDCVKRQMSLWSFTHPLGGPMHVERPFTFQPPPQARRPSEPAQRSP